MNTHDSVIEQLCATWESAAATEHVSTTVRCRSGLALPGVDAQPRFCFVSVGSPIELVLPAGVQVQDRSGEVMAVSELADRLLAGEVACVLAPRKALAPGSSERVMPDALITRRQEIRSANVLARFLLRQIGLEEVSSHRGAPAQLYRSIAELWSHDLALCTDIAMMLTLGADRQRHVDLHFTERATDRLPRALGRLHDLGIRSYPRLVIV